MDGGRAAHIYCLLLLVGCSVGNLPWGRGSCTAVKDWPKPLQLNTAAPPLCLIACAADGLWGALTRMLSCSSV